MAADPAIVPAAAMPGGWRGLAYYRLHGSPEIYTSAYSKVYLDALAQRIACWRRRRGASSTTLPAATANALVLLELLEKTRQIANGLP